MSILQRIVGNIYEAYPEISITIGADRGVSCPAFYLLADTYNLKYAIGVYALMLF